jgi:hypothetical protein
MITAFCYGLAVATATGLVGGYVWRHAAPALAALAGLAGAAVVMTAVSAAGHLGVHLTGAAIPALVFGLIAGGQVGHALTTGRPALAEHRS